MVEIGGLEPLATLPSIPAPAQPIHPSIFIVDGPISSPDYRQALAGALRAVAAAGQALVILAQVLESQTAQEPPLDRVTNDAAHCNGHSQAQGGGA